MWEVKAWVNGQLRMTRYIPVSLPSNLKQYPMALNSALLVDHVKVWNLLLLSVLRLLQKPTWWNSIIQFLRIGKAHSQNIATDFDRCSVLVMFVKLFDAQFEFISYWGRPVIHINIIASNRQQSQENPNRWEQAQYSCMHK